MTQAQALAILKTGTNVFLTGEPGSGKTFTVNSYVAWLREQRIPVAITASTGIAATHVGGFTIHSWSGIGIKRWLTGTDLNLIAGKSRIVKNIREVEVLIIDEVSMLSTTTLSMVDMVCRKVRCSSLPFGGLQVVLVGDFFQLPPIIRDNQATVPIFGLDALSKQSIFAFTSPAWQALNPMVCYLAEQHRQADIDFLDLLSALRRNAVLPHHRILLGTRKLVGPNTARSQLFAHNIDVDRINNSELAKLPASERAFDMTTHGPRDLIKKMVDGCLSPERLVLKIGARVMFTKNDQNYKFVNGSLGVVDAFSVEGYPIVKLLSGRNVIATPLDWTLTDGENILAKLTQVPLRLAWAMTVHKSQGMSLDAAHMDLSNVFEYGQGYVALSRVRTLQGLTLAGFNERALQVHPEILRKDQEFRIASEKAVELITTLTDTDRQRMEGAFVARCGGKIVSRPSGRAKKVRRPTHDITLELLLKKMSLAEIAAERNISSGTVIGHLQDLQLEKKITVQDIAHLVIGKESAIEKIQEAFVDIGVEALRPIYEYFDGQYSYDTIRLARLFWLE